MERITNLKKSLLMAGIFLSVIGFNSCSDDDDPFRPFGSIQVDDDQNLFLYPFSVQSVTVGQDSWLTAVKVGDENTNDFITEPVKVEKGTSLDVKMTFDEDAIPTNRNGQKVVLKLYADNPNGGTKGEWDTSDEPIKDGQNVLVSKTIMVFNLSGFNNLDTNGDGWLDAAEIISTYPDFDIIKVDSDGDGSINKEDFYNTIFLNSDFLYDETLDQEEWDLGYAASFNNWVENDFSTFDQNQNGHLDREEWNQIFEESGWFEGYDSNSDGEITEDEWNTGLFKDWDIDSDGQIDEEELNNYLPYVRVWWKW